MNQPDHSPRSVVSVLADILLWAIVAGFIAWVLAMLTDGITWLPADDLVRALLYFGAILVARYAARRLLYHDGRPRVKRP